MSEIHKVAIPRPHHGRGICFCGRWRSTTRIAALFALGGIVAVAGLLVAQTAPQAATPIRVGFVAPLSGAYAQNGRDILNGLRLYLEQIGSQAAGRKIELIVEDDEAIPANSLTKARKLVERDQVNVMAGALLSSTGYALAPYIESSQIPDLSGSFR